MKVNGKRFRYRERSVVVVCQNMNASDVQKLVPSISLSVQTQAGPETVTQSHSGVWARSTSVHVFGRFEVNTKTLQINFCV